MVRIECITAAHIPGIWAAYAGIVREGAYFSVDEPMDLASFESWITNDLGPQGVRLVAVIDDLVLGWCTIQQGPQACMQHAGTLFMGIVPQVRANGLGAALLATALDEAWANGLHRIQLDVYADNARAIALYRKFGFFDEGIRRHAHMRKGRYRDVLCMALLCEKAEEADENGDGMEPSIEWGNPLKVG
jgi:L-amino acid N-acyltransferase YncA